MVAAKTRLAACAAVLIGGLATWASADTTEIPDVQVNLFVDGQIYQYDPAGQTAWGNPNGTFGYYGGGDNSNHSIGWDMLVNPDPFIIASLIYTNTSGITQNVVVEVVLPIGMPMASSLIGGSVSGSVTDGNGDGALFASVGGGAVYQAQTDFMTAASLLNNASVSTGAYGSALIGPESFGEPIPSQPHGAILATMSIRYEFSLSAGDSAALTGTFVAIPGPGSLALLGLAGLVSRRRRR